MAKLGINTGTNPNDGQGDSLRVAMGKINSNFTEIYSTFGNGSNLDSIPNVAENLTGNPRINVSGILNVGVTTTEHIEVRNITSVGVVTAVQFVGDGSQLTNVTATPSGLEVLDDNVRRGVAKELNFGDNIVTTGPNAVGRVTISVANTAIYSDVAGMTTYATYAGISTNAQGLTGTPNITVGSVTGITASFSGNVSIGGTLTYEDVTNVDSIGLVTARTGIQVLAGGINAVGVITATSFSGSGANLTGVGIGSSGSINTTGIITATSFSGDGSNLTGVSGFSSALSSTQGSLLNTIFKTPKSFTIGAGTSVNIESDAGSGNIAFTRLDSIIVSSGSTLRVSTGTTFIMNVLNIF